MEIRKLKDPWAMWAWIQTMASNINCKKGDKKAITNMRKLATTMKKCTGNAWGF